MASFNGCNSWLQGTGDHQGIAGLQQLQALLQGKNFGHGTVKLNKAVFYANAAFSGTGNTDGSTVSGIPSSLAFLVNDVGAFFNTSFFSNMDNQTHTFQISDPQYAGASLQGRKSILLHEIGHQINAPGIQHDFGNQALVDANDHLVYQMCQPLIDGPKSISLTPTSGAVGTSVTIKGKNLGDVQGGSTITFNSNVPAAISSWANNQIVVKVPTGATTGNVIITIGGVAASKSFTVQ